MQFLGWLIALSFLTIACSERVVSRHQHEEGTPQAQTAKNELQIRTAETLAFESSAREASANPQNLLNFTQSFLTAKNLDNPRFLAETGSAQKLQTLNTTLLKNWDKTVSVQLKQHYVEQALGGCDGNLKGCLNLNFFRLDDGSAVILRKIAAEEKDLAKRYRLLLVAYEIKSRVADPELDSLYLDQAQTYEKTIASNTELLQRHRKVIGLLLQKANTSNIKTDGALTYVDWKISSTNNVLSSSQKDLLRQLSKNKLYADTSKKSLHPDFSKSLHEILNTKEGFLSLQQDLIKKTPLAVKQIGIQPIQDANEYLYMIDRVFNEHLSAQDMIEVFMNSTMNLKLLSEVARSYIEIQMLTMIHDSHSAMAKHLTSEKVYTNSIWEESKREGQFIVQKADTFLRRADAVYGFAEAAYEKLRGNLPKDENTFFLSLRGNLKYFLTYPQMFAISYMLSERKYEGTLTTGHGYEFTVNHASIMDFMFDAKFRPWFLYGHGGERLGKTEILIALEFAVKTGALTMFNVKVEDFYNKLFSTLLKPHQLKSEERYSALVAKFDVENWQTMQKFCAYLPGQPKVPFSLSIDDLVESPAGDLSKLIGQNVFLHIGFNTLIKDIEFEQRPLQRRLQAVALSYENYLNSAGLPEAEIQQKLQKAMLPLNDLKRTQDAFFAKFASIQKVFDPCFGEIAQYTNQLKIQLLEYERKYLLYMHKLMKNARTQGGQVDWKKLSNEVKFYKLPIYEGGQSFDKDGMMFYYSDLFMRFKFYLEKGLKTDTENLPAIQPYFQITFKETFKANTVLSRNTHLEHYGKAFEKIFYTEDPEAFVTSCLNALQMNDSSPVLGWFRFSGTTVFHEAGRNLWMWPVTLAYLYNMTSMGTVPETTVVDMNALLSWGDIMEKSMSISPEEEIWVERMGALGGKLLMTFLDGVMIKTETKEPLPPYEWMAFNFGQYTKSPFQGNTGEDAGGNETSSQEIKVNPNLYDEVQEFHLLVKELPDFAFRTKVSFFEKLTEIYKTEVRAFDKRTLEFLDAIDQKYQKDLARGQLLQPSYRPQQRYSGPYLSPGTYSSLRSRSTIFHQNTDEKFR